MYKAILKLDRFFWKYEEGGRGRGSNWLPLLGKTTFKKPSLIRVKIIKWKISTLFMRHNQVVFSFLLTYFVHERLWHHHVFELDFKNIDSLISREVKFWTYIGSTDSIIKGKKCINSRLPLWGTALTESQPFLLGFNHFALSYSIRR